MPEKILQEEGDEDKLTAIKANTLMASKSRIDDDRMMKVKPQDGKFLIDHFSVSEREQMLGLPVKYVSEPVGKLFEELRDKAFVQAEGFNIEGELLSWRDFLDRSLWHFRNCRFDVEGQMDPPFFQLKLSIPWDGKKRVYKVNDYEKEEIPVREFFNEDQYCKHLLGNGWSLPVVEYILGGLEQICDKRRDYEGYDYNYPWMPHKSAGKVQQQSETIEI